MEKVEEKHNPRITESNNRVIGVISTNVLAA